MSLISWPYGNARNPLRTMFCHTRKPTGTAPGPFIPCFTTNPVGGGRGYRAFLGHPIRGGRGYR
eukprot:5634107-Karenia_brevis.AAC.1